MKPKIYSASTKRYKQTNFLKKATPKDRSVQANSDSANRKEQKLFYELDYLFSEPAKTKKQAARKLFPSKNNKQTINTSFLKSRLIKSDLVQPNNKQSQPINNSFFNLSSISQQQNRKYKLVDLNFNQNSPVELIHHRRFASHLHPFPLRNQSRQAYRTVQCQSSTIQQCLTTRSFVNQSQREETYEKPIAQTKLKQKNNQFKNNSICGFGQLLLTKKKKWFQSEQFIKYYAKEVQFAKRAFIDKNKQTIKIYRPWTPTQLEIEEPEHYHF